MLTMRALIYEHYQKTGETEFTVEDRIESQNDDAQIKQLEFEGVISVQNRWINGWEIKLLRP